MINKKSLWFLTLFSLILVLSIYYITMPSELLLKTNSKNHHISKIPLHVLITLIPSSFRLLSFSNYQFTAPYYHPPPWQGGPGWVPLLYCKNEINTPAATAEPITPEMFEAIQ